MNTPLQTRIAAMQEADTAKALREPQVLVQPTLVSTIEPTAAPDSPASGWTLYVDSGDGNKLKAKASTGTVVTLATP